MKIITPDELEQHVQEYIALANEEVIVVKLANGALIRICETDEEAVEEDLFDDMLENDPRFIELIESRRESYRKEGGIPFEVGTRQLVRELIDDLDAPDMTVRDEAVAGLIKLAEWAIAEMIATPGMSGLARFVAAFQARQGDTGRNGSTVEAPGSLMLVPGALVPAVEALVAQYGEEHAHEGMATGSHDR